MWYLISKLSKSFYNESDLLFLVHHWGRLTSHLRVVLPFEHSYLKQVLKTKILCDKKTKLYKQHDRFQNRKIGHGLQPRQDHFFQFVVDFLFRELIFCLRSSAHDLDHDKVDFSEFAISVLQAALCTTKLKSENLPDTWKSEWNMPKRYTNVSENQLMSDSKLYGLKRVFKHRNANSHNRDPIDSNKKEYWPQSQ